MTRNGARDRVAVVAGLRTPFAKQGTAYRDMTTLDLGRIVVKELLARAELDPREIGLVVYGQAVPTPTAPNIAREIVLGSSTMIPKSVEAYSVVRACATSFQSATSAAEAILAGQHDVAVTGGVDSASDVPITVSRKLARTLVEQHPALPVFAMVPDEASAAVPRGPEVHRVRTVPGLVHEVLAVCA